MKHIYIQIICCLVLLGLAGCRQDEWQSQQQETRLTSVKATVPASVRSRTQLSGNSVIWERSDAIGIFSNASTEAVRYDLTGIEDGVASFESETGVSGDEFYAFYPYSAQSTTNGSRVVSFHLPNEQDYRSGSFDTGVCPMVAKSTTDEFRFLQTCGIIRLRLTGTMAISSISLRGNGNEAIVGDGTIDIASDAPVFSIHGDAFGSVRLRTSDNVQLTETNATEFHFVIAPQTFAKGITVEITGIVNGQKQVIRKQTSKSVTVTRSVISSFAAVDADAELELEGPTDWDVLVALYDATNGDNWTNNDNWCTDKPLSEWYGVTMDYYNEKVTLLNLNDNNLSGTIPEEIENLDLSTLNLSNNQLTGEMPASIGNVSTLYYLNIANNKLTGSIPSELGKLANLEYCYLHNNQLTGGIPSELGNLSKLRNCYLHNNQLTGGIPSELGNLSKLRNCYLYNNQLTGSIPSELGKLANLESCCLHNNQLAGSIPSEFGNLSKLSNCYLYNNQLTGSIPSEFGKLANLEICYLFGNQLEGTLPESLANLTKLSVMDFSGNMLGGDLPEAVTATDWWQRDGYVCIRQNAPGGFTFETVNLHIPDFTATDNRGNTIRTADIVSDHKVTLYYIWATGYSREFHPVMSELYQRYKNHSLEIIGVCDDGISNPAEANNYIESNNMEWPTLMGNPEGGIAYSGFPTVIAFDETGKMIFHDDFMSRDELPTFLKGILGEGDEPYESTDYSADKKVVTLQKAARGNGINVVLMGDAFSDRQIADGTYESVMRQAAEAFFSEEPYTSFKDLFNVYYVNAVSKNEGYVTGGETVFSCYFGEGTHVGGADELCMQYAQSVGFTDEQMQDVLIIVMMNSTKYAGTCWMYYNTNCIGDYGRGTSVAYFPIGTSYEDLSATLHHEAGGHGFAKLADEYAYEYMGTIPDHEILDYQRSREDYGWWKNTDYISDPAQVYWSKFIDDSRYDFENIGVYEGACTYWKGAYRPTESSIMRNNSGGFNAPSREAIYYRIHKLAYGESWPYDYEEFVSWDLNRRVRSRSVSVSQKKYPLAAPPVIINARWENGRFIYE